MAENQLDILEGMLKEKGIEYKRIDEFTPPPEVVFANGVGEFHQIRGTDKDVEWDVICHHGSYGYEEGLLEYSDNIEPDVIGNLTADKVIKLIDSAQYRKGYADAVNKFQLALESIQGGGKECVFGTGD